jgi:uncharacterized membrane protein YphA (DoxX/SURF4 family)
MQNVLERLRVNISADRTEFAPSQWNLAQRVVFRFVCAYFILYNLPSPGHVSLLSVIPGTGFLSQAYERMWRALVPWVAVHVFHLSGPATVYPAVNGSGDSTLDYIQNFCFLVFAGLAALVWSALDRKRKNYRRLHSWMRIWVRYVLAFTLFGYGFAKVFPLQFQPAGLSRLIEPFGEFSPMGVLWSFMGASMAYTIFSGAAEVTGGLLLLFRRTTTLGALVSAAVLLNVVMLNFCYDVPVKLYSLNLLLMAIFLAAPDLNRLAKVLVLNRPARPANIDPPFKARWLRIAAIGLKILIVGYVLFTEVKGGLEGYRRYYVNVPRPPLYGLYEVESFTRNGQDVPPIITDATRWKRLIVQSPASLSVRLMNDAPRPYSTEYDSSGNRVTLFAATDKDKRYVFDYSRPDPDHVVLQGTLANDSLSVKLRKIDTSKFLLVSRGFHWINERPFNR